MAAEPGGVGGRRVGVYNAGDNVGILGTRDLGLMDKRIFNDDVDSPLETPGTVAVVGGGVLGIEAALYGRYLGYKVTVFESETVGHRVAALGDEPLPMLPDRSFSPLAASALAAQTDDRPASLPMTCGQWCEQILRPLAVTDLLRGNVREGVAVRSIRLGESEIDDDGDELPPDFVLGLSDGTAETFEAVLVTVAGDDADRLDVAPEGPVPYGFGIHRGNTGNAEADFALGLKRIVTVFANLADRADLDLYAPRRG